LINLGFRLYECKLKQMKAVLYSIIILTGVFVIAACGESKPGVKAKFIIVNRSGFDIDSVRIGPGNDSRTIRLKNSDSVYYYSDMTGLPQVDGAYCLRFRNLNSKTTRAFGFGYFTNGYPLEESTRVTIFADTVFIKQYYSNY
jgi:hypothetical protein